METTYISSGKISAKKAVLILIIVTTVIRLTIAAITGLGFGESYYAMGVVHPQWSYFDQPPLSFWLGWLSVEGLRSYSTFALRLPTVLLFAGTTWLMYLLGKRLFSEWAGFWAAVILNLSAVFTYSVGIWLQPDAPLMFFWLACAIWLYDLFSLSFTGIEERNRYRSSWDCYRRWIIIGVLLGLTTLSKYHAAFLFAGAGIFALTRREERHWIRHPGPYLALMINLIIAAPVFIWNYNHDWASFAFQSHRAVNTGLHIDWFFRSIGGQMLWVLPWIWIPLVWQLYSCFRAGRGDRARWFCLTTAILPIIFFTLVTLWANLGFHFHWQAPGYLMLFPPLGAAFYHYISKGGTARKWSLRWVWLSVIVTIFSSVVIQVHSATGFWSSYGPKWFAQLFGEKNDPTMEGYDYNRMFGYFEDNGWLDPDKYFVVTDRWWLTGKVDWVLKGRLPVVTFDSDPRNVAFFFDQHKLLGKDAVFIACDAEVGVMSRAKPYFAEVKRLDNYKVIRAGVEELEFSVYYCRDYEKVYPLPYGWNVE